MELVFDNIIFSLQRAGGISVYWYEILKRALDDNDIFSTFIDQEGENIFRDQLPIKKDKILDKFIYKFPNFVTRYLNITNLSGDGIFHSSYYRIANSDDFVNVTTVHDFTYEYFRTGIPKYVHSEQKRRAILNSDHIICVSKNTKSDLLKFYPNINESNVQVIYNGVNDCYQILSNSEGKRLSKLIPFKKGSYALYVGDRKSEYKNFTLTVKACIKSNTPLALVGGGEVTNLEMDWLNRLGRNNYILLEGISNKKLNLLYNYALCLIYPSTYEGFGIPVIEAQKAGCPVVASNKSAIGEVIGPVDTLGDDVTVGGISEMIERYKTDIDYLNQQTRLGLENAKRFSWDKCYKETKKVYKKLYYSHFQ